MNLTDRVRELESQLRNLLARIHRDGGHRTEALGSMDAAVEDADAVVAQAYADKDAAEAKLARAREARDILRAGCFHPTGKPGMALAALEAALADDAPAQPKEGP